MKIRAFITHKKAEHFSDCQDRFSISMDTKSVAVSDGMSQSWQQKIWAQLLVDTFCSDTDWVPTLESVRELSPMWKNEVENYIQSLRDADAKESLIYRNERNLAEGKSSGATLVGIRFKSNNWDCDVLGDSCLIAKIGNDYMFGTSQDTEKFDNHPDYFDSDSNKQGRGTFKTFSESLSSSNPFVLLVSDPFSDYLLEHKKIGDIDVLANELLSINTHDEFEAIVAKWRDTGMHNDDSTLVIVEYDGSEDWNILHQDKLDELIQTEQHSIHPSTSVPKVENGVIETPREKKNETSLPITRISEKEFCDKLESLGLKKFSTLGFADLIFRQKTKRKICKILAELAKEIYDHFDINKKN